MKVINFQLSLLLYSLLLGLIAIPIFLLTVLKNISVSEFSNHHEFLFRNFTIENMSEILIIAILAVIIYLALKI